MSKTGKNYRRSRRQKSSLFEVRDDKDNAPGGTIWLPQNPGVYRKEFRPEMPPCQDILDMLPVAVSVKCIDTGIFVYWNKQCEKLFSLTAQEVIGRSVYDLYPKEQADMLSKQDRVALEYKGDMDIAEEVLEHTVHGRIYLHTRKSLLHGDQGEPRWLLNICEDITNFKTTKDRLERASENLDHHVEERIQSLTEYIGYRKQVEEGLLESEARYKRLLDAVTDYIYTVTVENGRAVKTVHCPGCVAVTGYTAEDYESNSLLWYQMIFDDDREKVLRKTDRILRGEITEPLEHRIIHKDGSIRWVRNTAVSRFDERGILIGYDSLITDVTEKKRLEEELMHAQKLDAVGQMAGGIAHDFNNILTAISGFATLMLMKMSPEDPLRRNTEHIISAAERAATLTKSLLSFSRKDTIDPKPTCLKKIIDSVHNLLTRLISEEISLYVEHTEHDITVMADSGQIGQVLINLVANARDAMPQGGRVCIGTSVVKMNRMRRSAGVHDNNDLYAVLSVSDTGTGIEPHIREKIFEPFFTTKGPGKGTGLGLSLIHGIVQQHKGHIDVSSEPGKGTEFRISLPLFHADSAVSGEKGQGHLPVMRGTETVLLVEDDDAVRHYLSECLCHHGYTVMEASDGGEAVSIFRNHHQRIEVVLTDVIMPVKNGLQVHHEIKRIRPDSRVLFMSGYTSGVFESKGIVDNGSKLLMKPVPPHILLAEIRELLDAPPRTGVSPAILAE